MDNKKEYIICAAIKRKKRRNPQNSSGRAPYWNGTNDILDIEIGYRHHDIFMRFGKGELETSPNSQGFYTSNGRYVNRVEAMEVAYLCGQVSEKTALDKSYLDIPISINGSYTVKDENKYNMLFSEDLY